MLRSDIPISLPVQYLIDYDDTLGVDCDQSEADVASFIIPFLCAVLESGVVVTEVCAGSTSTPQVDFDLRPTAGDDTSRGAADIGHLVLSTSAAGVVMYDKVAIGTRLEPGQEVVCELKLKAEGTPTGHFRPYLLVEHLPEVDGNLSKTETA